MAEVEQKTVEQIAFWLMEQAPEEKKVLILIERQDGTNRSMDNGLKATEAKELLMSLHSYIDQCLGREMEREGNSNGDRSGN